MNRDHTTGFYGYKNTQAVVLFAENKGWTLKDAFPAVYWVTDNKEGYEHSHPAPTNSSGCFLPSVVQCRYWQNNRDVLLNSVRKATGDNSYRWKSWYWSSSEANFESKNYAWSADSGYGDVIEDRKDNRSCVRAWLAF